ncbi:MAG: YybH family protein [Vicinamibacteria bacterium]
MIVPSYSLLLLLAGQTTSQATETEVKNLVIAFNQAYEKNDLEKYFSYYADDVTQWFESGRAGLPDYKKSWSELIEGGGGVEKNELSDIRVQVSPGGDAAVATYVVDVVTRGVDGKKTRERAYETDVWFKRGGTWKIAHLHYNSKEVP